MRTRSLLLTLLAPLMAASPASAQEEPTPAPGIFIEVLEDAWVVGDEKTYTLLFDRAPFGRQAMRLEAIRTSPDGGREAVFEQRITLDLRALGQTGALEHTGTIVYRENGSGTYRYQEGLLRETGYATYRKRSDFSEVIEVELDSVSGTYRVGAPGADKKDEEGDLPAPAGAVLVDLLMLGHWERVLEGRPSWPLGESFPETIIVPSALPRFDYHIPAEGARPVEPQVVEARLTVEAREEIDLFGARVDAYRCRIEPTGMTLWVSPHGGVLLFQDDRGLSGSLER
jgi:hypothetical protein